MSKDVLITEDGNSRVFENVAKIRTSLSGGGTCDWIPKDDVPLQTLEVSQDGVYRPEENYYGFDKVIASGIGNTTMGNLIEKTIKKNGTYNIRDEKGDPYGYSKIIVNVDTSDDSGGGSSGGGGSASIVGKDEDGNDTMVETDGESIVMTALPTSIKVIIPPNKLYYTQNETIDYNGISVYAYISKEVHWLGTTSTAIFDGSSKKTITIGSKSITVSTGDGVLYAPDRTGAKDLQLVWDGNKWVKLANYSAEKTIWKSKQYPSGKIPFGELTFPVKTANYTSHNIKEVTVKARNKYIVTCNTYNPTSGERVKISVRISPGRLEIIDEGKRTYDGTRLKRNWRETYIYDGYFVCFDEIVAFINDSNAYTLWTYAEQDYAIDGSVISDVARVSNIEIFGDTFDDFGDYHLGFSAFYDKCADDCYCPPHPYYNTNLLYGDELNDCVHVRFLNGINVNEALYEQTRQDPSGETYYNKITHNWVIKPDNNGPVPITFHKRDLHGHYDPAVLDLMPTTGSITEIVSWFELGERIEIQQNTGIDVPVQWKRPGDGKILETTFNLWIKDDGGES